VIRPGRPAWVISVQKAGHAVLAILFAAPAALIVWKLSIWRLIGPLFGFTFFLVSFVVLAVVFYSFLEWFRKRPDEIAKRVPTPSKELRRKKEAFYNWLASQGRR
jgi:membrane protein implicated in regulation of membrane protease activity